MDTLHGEVASKIKGLESAHLAGALAHKLAHTMAGCMAGAAASG